MFSRLVLVIVCLVFVVSGGMAQVEFEIQEPSQAMIENYKRRANTGESVNFLMTLQLDTHCAILKLKSSGELHKGVCVFYEAYRDITYLYVAPYFQDLLIFRDGELTYIGPSEINGTPYVEIDPAPGDYEVFIKHYTKDETKVVKFTISD